MSDQPKYKMGQFVTVNGMGRYEILGVVKHGLYICDCCRGEEYYLYKIVGFYWMAEDKLGRTVN